MSCLIPVAERDAIVADILTAHLDPLGFHMVRARRWVNGALPPARMVFEMQLLKGATMAPAWGFSLDFVPHVAAGRIAWHASDKKAMLDVVVNPPAPHFSFLQGSDQLRADLKNRLPSILAVAQQDWKARSDVRALLTLVRDIKETRRNIHGFDIYTQLPLALAFLLAKTGDLAEAEKEIDRQAAYGKHEASDTETLKQLLCEVASESPAELRCTVAARADEVRSGKAKGRPIEEVMAELRQKHK